MTTFNINDQVNELVKVTSSGKQTLAENNDSTQQEMTDKSAKGPNFFRDNKPSEKAHRKDTTTRIKFRKFLSNEVSYLYRKKESTR